MKCQIRLLSIGIILASSTWTTTTLAQNHNSTCQSVFIDLLSYDKLHSKGVEEFGDTTQMFADFGRYKVYFTETETGCTTETLDYL